MVEICVIFKDLKSVEVVFFIIFLINLSVWFLYKLDGLWWLIIVYWKFSLI